jgi:hypothetical protein
MRWTLLVRETNALVSGRRSRVVLMPSSQHALMEATKKRAAKLEAKGKPVDFKALLRVEPDGGTTNIRNVRANTARDGSASRTAVWCRSTRLASSTRPRVAISGSPSKEDGAELPAT